MTFASSLLAWYDINRRDLPWRQSPTDPYHILVSEMMLQQTTVKAVIPYYNNFMKRWPTLRSLATSELDDLLHVWQGLGYYRRAQSLHKCSQDIVQNYGDIPSNEEILRKLPGIGPYTAAAIAAIAFQKPTVALDGNIVRILSRYFALNIPLPALKKAAYEKGANLLDPRRPGDYTQALMDLGASICRPKNPSCPLCPLKIGCRAFGQSQTEIFPITIPKKPLPHRYGVVFWAERSDLSVFIQRAKLNGLLGGLMEFPSTSWENALPSQLPFPAPGHWTPHNQPIHHVFTHFKLTLHVWRGQVEQLPKLDGLWVFPENFREYPFSTCMKKVIKLMTAKQ